MRTATAMRLLLFSFIVLTFSHDALAQIAVGISVSFGPPALPVYEQPICPGYGYMWTPGYWAYGEEGYFWVPGTWVMAPEIGLLWTPGYWGWGGNAFTWNEGYWGANVGFYGGVNYGFGYAGTGYQGGYWRNGSFYYNRSVNNVNVTNIHNVYNKTAISNNTYNHVSYNGGNGGTRARPTAAEETASRERHTPATSAQTEHQQAAGKNHELLASVNHGRPAIAATAKPAEFGGHGVVAAKHAGGSYRATESKAAATRSKENKTAENKAAASKENKAAENKAARPKEPHPPSESKRTAAHAKQATHRQTAPRAEAAPHAQPASHPATTARAQPAPHPAKEAPKAEERPRN
jgi:WXXGXW repeat (2 copies)